jgi:hypothetical protein
MTQDRFVWVPVWSNMQAKAVVPPRTHTVIADDRFDKIGKFPASTQCTGGFAAD